MDIANIANASFKLRAETQVSAGSNNLSGQSFLSKMFDVSRAANIEITKTGLAGSLTLSRQEEEKEAAFSFDQAEEKIIEHCVDRITKLLDHFKKNHG